MFKHILVPVDGSELGDSTVRRTCAFAKETGARLTFYHAKPAYFPPVIAGEGVFNDTVANETFRASADSRAEAILRSARQAAIEAGVACETLSSECHSPYEGIIATAESQACDLIFMSSHGLRGGELCCSVRKRRRC
jgi:nucleotide-binding universal stress UspA family protein